MVARKPPLTDAEKMRLKALGRWADEGGADPCGPQVPGAPDYCAEEEEEPSKHEGGKDPGGSD